MSDRSGSMKSELAMDIPSPKYRGLVVTSARMRWKLRHATPNELAVRMVRYVWMRHPFPWESVPGLHAVVLGSAMRAGLLAKEDERLSVTEAGKELIDGDRKREKT